MDQRNDFSDGGMTVRLAGKTAVVTAAAAGIGRAIALAFAQQGARVIALDVDFQGLAVLGRVQESIRAEVLDVTEKDAIERLFRREPKIDVLVNAVGFVHSGTILECSDTDWSRSVLINLTSMMYMVRACVPTMVSLGGGSIINVASVASSVRGVPSRFAYSTTKAGVIGLTKSVAADFVTNGIRCNAICPGTIDTPSLSVRLRASGDEEKARAAFTARQPMGRLGTAEEVAALAVYLASDESAFTTGAIHVIDGGWTM
jgi:2-keto-3-deoxy-L-fuconate dehydrogenase